MLKFVLIALVGLSLGLSTLWGSIATAQGVSTRMESPSYDGRLVAQANPTWDALQAAIDAKDTGAILAILISTLHNQRELLAAL